MIFGGDEVAAAFVFSCLAVWAGTCVAHTRYLLAHVVGGGKEAGPQKLRLPLQSRQLPDSRVDVCLAPARRTPALRNDILRQYGFQEAFSSEEMFLPLSFHSLCLYVSIYILPRIQTIYLNGYFPGGNNLPLQF